MVSDEDHNNASRNIRERSTVEEVRPKEPSDRRPLKKDEVDGPRERMDLVGARGQQTINVWIEKRDLPTPERERYHESYTDCVFFTSPSVS